MVVMWCSGEVPAFLFTEVFGVAHRHTVCNVYDPFLTKPRDYSIQQLCSLIIMCMNYVTYLLA